MPDERWSMIRTRSVALAQGEDRLSEKIMLKQRDEIMIRSSTIEL